MATLPPDSGTPPPGTTSDPFNLVSGKAESAKTNLGDSEVAILDVNCEVVDYPLLGSGGVPNSFENTRGVVNVNSVTLSKDVDGNILWFVEDYGTKEEIEDGDSSCINRQVLINVPDAQLVSDPIAEDGSMDVTVTLQQYIKGEPTDPISFTKNIPNPVQPGVGTPPPDTDTGTPPPDTDTGTPPPDPGIPTTTTTPAPVGRPPTPTTTVAPTVIPPPPPPPPPGPGGAVIQGAPVFIALTGPGSLQELNDKLQELVSSTGEAINEANLALDAKTVNGPFRPGLKWLKRVIDRRTFSVAFENRVRDSYDAAKAAEGAYTAVLPLVESSLDILKEWQVAYNQSENEGKPTPVEPWLNDIALVIDSLKTAATEANLLGSRSQALGSEVGADARWKITELTENAAIYFSDNVIPLINRIFDIVQTYIQIKAQIDKIREQMNAAAAAAESERLERERLAEEKRKAEAAAAAEKERERQRLSDLNAEAEARAAGKAEQALADKLERERQAAERAQAEEERQERLDEINQRRDEIRERQRDELIPSLSDQDLVKRLDDTRHRLAGVQSGSIPDPLGLLARWLPEDITAFEEELDRRREADEAEEAKLIANIRLLREQQIQERDEAIPTMSNDELLQELSIARTTLNGVNAGLIKDTFGLMAIYLQENIDAYEAEIARRQAAGASDSTTTPPPEQLWKLTITNEGDREERFKEWLLFAGGDVVVESLAPGESITITKTENIFSFGVVLGAGSSIRANNFTYTATASEDETTINGYVTEGFEGSITISPRSDIPSEETTTPEPTTTTPEPTTTTPPPCPPGKERIGGKGPCVEKCPEGWRRDADGNCYDPDPVDDDASDSSGGTDDSIGWPGLIQTGPDPLTFQDFTYTTTTSTTTYTTPYYTTPPPPCTVTTPTPPTYSTVSPERTTVRPRIREVTTRPPAPPPPPPKPIYPAPILPLQVPFIMNEVTTTSTTTITTTTTPPPIATRVSATTTLCPEDPDCNNLQF